MSCGEEEVKMTNDTPVSFSDDEEVKIKLRKGRYIISIDQSNLDNINLKYHIDRYLKQCVFNAFKKKEKKPRKLDTVENLTPEQLEKKRESRRRYYQNNKERINALSVERYNNDPEYWRKKLTAVVERYRKSRENVENKRPGRKPKNPDIIKDTPSTSKDKPKKQLGRPRKVSFE